MEYNHPQYLVIREALKEPHSGAITAAAATGALVGSTFRTFHKSVVFGVTGICSAAGSGGTGVITVGRRQAPGGTASLTTKVLSPTTLAANAITSLVFTSPITLVSAGDCVFLHGSASAATDIAELGAVIWRYRMLPTPGSTDVSDDYSNTILG